MASTPGQARRLQWRRAGRWRAWPTAILALIAINAALIVRRADVVRWVPQTASLYAAIGLPVNLRGLDFADVTTKKETQDGVQMLVVEGTIVSTVVACGRRAAPALRRAQRSRPRNLQLDRTAGPQGAAGGDTMPFRSRLASPPPEGRDVLVRFFNRRDLVADIQ